MQVSENSEKQSVRVWGTLAASDPASGFSSGLVLPAGFHIRALIRTNSARAPSPYSSAPRSSPPPFP